MRKVVGSCNPAAAATFTVLERLSEDCTLTNGPSIALVEGKDGAEASALARVRSFDM